MEKKNMKKIEAEDKTHTNIRISNETKERFDSLGKYGESADDIMKRLIGWYKETHSGSRVRNYFKSHGKTDDHGQN